MLMSLVREEGIKITLPQFLQLLSAKGEGRLLLDRMGFSERAMDPKHDRERNSTEPLVKWPAGVPGWVRDASQAMSETVGAAQGSLLAAIQADRIPSMITFRAGNAYTVFLLRGDDVVGMQCTAKQVADLVKEYSQAAAVSPADWSIGWHAGNSSQILKKTSDSLSVGVAEGGERPQNLEELLAPLFA